MSEIIDSILNENLLEVKRILEEEPSLIDEKDSNGVLAALIAAGTGNLDLIRYIVEYSRASMNITDDRHRNMLHFAVKSGNLESCVYLVERVGLSPTSGDLDLVTPYEIAHKNHYKDIEDYFETVVGAPYDQMYHNPIRTGMFPDPSIVRVDDNYYMVNSSFIYFPCIPVSVSKDLVHWKIIGYAITDPEWANIDHLEGGRGYWAPDISYYDGKFYITATYRMNDDGTVYRKQIVVSSVNPEGPYSKPAIIDEDGIDPSIFNDEDGRRYMLLNRGARIFELNKDATKQISEATLLYYGDNKRAPEGPHLLKKDGYYYLFQAEGGTGPGHRISVARSKTLMGCYEPCPYNPIMRQTDESAMIQRCGHGKPVQTQNGQWYMVYLCGRKIGEGYSMLGRETALDPITWTADGWPIVNHLAGPSVLQIKPNLPEQTWKTDHDHDYRDKYSDDNCNQHSNGYSEYSDDFNESSLGTNWISPRAPEKDGYTLKESHVYIKGSRFELSSVHARNILLRRQQHFQFTAICKMMMPDADSMKDAQNAGVTCYYDENTFLKFGVYAREHNLELKIVENIGDKVIEDTVIPVDASKEYLYLKIETDYLKRTFFYSYDGIHFIKAGCLENVYYLCDEGLKKGKRFTGAMIGMYAYAGDTSWQAAFDSFQYIPYETK